MLNFLAQPETAPFTIALVLMLLVGVVEAIGLGGSAVDLDVDDGPVAGSLDWLNVGRLPLLVLVVVMLTAFGLSGLVIQQIAIAAKGVMAPLYLAVPAAIALAFPGTRLASRGLARVLPHDETTAVDIETLVGRRARIVIGTATKGNPARARVEDQYGHMHYVMVEPVDESAFNETTLLLLTARDGVVFRAVELDPDIFSLLRPLP